MKITQTEARRLRKHVKELEDVLLLQRQRWTQDWPQGISLGSLTRSPDWLTGRIDAARILGHAVVITQTDDGKITFYAAKLSA